MKANSEKLQQTYNELLEFKMVLQKVHSQTIDAHHLFLSMEKLFALFEDSELGHLRVLEQMNVLICKHCGVLWIFIVEIDIKFWVSKAELHYVTYILKSRHFGISDLPLFMIRKHIGLTSRYNSSFSSPSHYLVCFLSLLFPGDHICAI